jgi:hypothetical protein
LPKIFQQAVQKKVLFFKEFEHFGRIWRFCKIFEESEDFPRFFKNVKNFEEYMKDLKIF